MVVACNSFMVLQNGRRRDVYISLLQKLFKVGPGIKPNADGNARLRPIARREKRRRNGKNEYQDSRKNDNRLGRSDRHSENPVKQRQGRKTQYRAHDSARAGGRDNRKKKQNHHDKKLNHGKRSRREIRNKEIRTDRLVSPREKDSTQYSQKGKELPRKAADNAPRREKNDEADNCSVQKDGGIHAFVTVFSSGTKQTKSFSILKISNTGSASFLSSTVPLETLSDLHHTFRLDDFCGRIHYTRFSASIRRKADKKKPAHRRKPDGDRTEKNECLEKFCAILFIKKYIQLFFEYYLKNI